MRAWFPRLVAVLALAACQGGSPTRPADSAPAPSPTIGLSDVSEQFTVTAGGSSPAPATIRITNGGTGTLSGLSVTPHVDPGEPTGWLAATLDHTSAPATLSIAATTGNLAAGTYHAIVDVASSAATNSPQQVDVTFLVNPAAGTPTIALSPSSVSFTAPQGGADPATQTLQVTNGGGGTLTGLGSVTTYAAGEPANWLVAQLGTTDAPTTLTLQARTGGLAAGSYHATVTLTSPGADNSPLALPVTFTVTAVTAAPTISLSASAVSFSATQGGPAPAAKTVQVTNAGGGSLSGLQASSSAGWLSATLSGTTAPATLTLQAVTAGLSAGTHTATVSITSPVAGNSPQTVTVTLQLAAVTLPAPVLQTPTVNGTTVTLTWTFAWPGGLGSSNDGYLVEESTSPSSGFTVIANPATHQSPYALDVTGLSAGTYYFRVRASTYYGLSPYSTVQSAVVAGSASAQITITNALSPVGSDEVMRFRLASSLSLLTSAANTSAEQLSPDSYCGALPGLSIGPGESKTFDVSSFAPDYFVHIGLGIWDNSDGSGGTTCWQKKMWSLDTNSNLIYLFVNVQVSNQTGPLTWTLTYSGNNLVLRTPSGDIPVVVSNQDPIH